MEATDSATHPGELTAHISRFVFFCLPLAYSLTFARYWLSDSDEGFLLGNAWRVIHGQIPYRDFIYARPPLPILLQTLPLLVLPDAFQLIAGRIYFYLCVAGYSLIASDLLLRAFGLRARPIDRFLLAAAAFVFSAHDFPPMAWHTTDGILFATLGVALLYDAKRQAAIAAGCFCLVLAALSKQPFYLVALSGPLFAGALNGRRAGLSAAAWLAIEGLVAAGAISLCGAGASFASQTIRALGIGGGFVGSGISAYLDCSFAQCLVALGFGCAASLIGRRLGWNVDHGISVGIGVIALFATILGREAFPIVKRFTTLESTYNPYALLWIGMAVVATEISRRRRDILVLAELLFIAWASGITRGAQGPGLFAAPLLFSLLYVCVSHLRSRHVHALQWLLIGGGVITFSLLYFGWPRGHEPGSAYPTVSLGAISPKLAFVQGSPYTFRKYRELLAARERYGERLSVLPGLPLAYFVLDSQNPLPLDLVGGVELCGEEAWFLRALENDVDYVLLERMWQRPDASFEPECVDRVRTTWIHVETLEAFEVYRNPRATELGSRGSGS